MTREAMEEIRNLPTFRAFCEAQDDLRAAERGDDLEVMELAEQLADLAAWDLANAIRDLAGEVPA